jgi:SAM-dependent methyltransferase
MIERARIIETYAGAAEHFDDLPFWGYFGKRTVERLGLTAGARVLDLCCGTGASVFPAAERVGPGGHVIGVDLTEALLERGRKRAAAAGLTNVEFRAADVEALSFEPASFDAIVSVFGFFFLTDMPAMLARAWTWLRPGGVIALTTWGEHVLEPGEHLFWDAVHREDGSIREVSPADRLSRTAQFGALFGEAGLLAPSIETEVWQMPLPRPEDFWPVILGTSNRAGLETLSEAARRRVQAAVIEGLRARSVRALDLEAHYATARVPLDRDG